MRKWIGLVVVALACTGTTPDAADGPDDTDVVDTEGGVDTDRIADSGNTADTALGIRDTAGEDTDATLNGRQPATPVSLPADFVAYAHTGVQRGPLDLTGQPTVLWFFPRADTAG